MSPALTRALFHNEMELYRGIVSGNESALKMLHQQFYRQLVYFGYKITRQLSYAEEAASEAFIKAWNARTSLKSPDHLKNYLFLSTKHACIDFLKSQQVQKKMHEQLLYLADGAEENIERLMTESRVVREIATEIASLPPQCHKVFSYIFFEGMTTDEIAAKMNISNRNVLNQKAIAIKMIRSGLLKKGLLSAFLYFLKNY